MQKTFSIKLDTGTLHLEVEPGRIPLNRLLGFAARVSSKRKFLLVSKLLGKHYPVSPQRMSWSYRVLAKRIIKSGAGGESLWIGMAETATGLGYGVFEAASHAGIKDSLFIQTTRYHLEGNERLEFEEAHSHATDFFLYYPDDPSQRDRFLNAKTLVLIDDEISTGKTFLRLIKAYQAVNPHLSRILIVSLCVFAHPEDREFLEVQSAIPVEWICFRQGLLRFEDSLNFDIDNITVNVSSNGNCKKDLLAWPGRLGMNAAISLETDTVETLAAHFRTPGDPRPILVLGTGECNAPAYLLGRELERKGFKVMVQSTTRSPIHLGNDIRSICQFEDNYQDNIPNYIYNMNPDDYREIILCHETPICAPLSGRLADWQAISARFELNPQSFYAKLHFFRP
ncbi:MAG: phosphoribosyltransferase domain-containing protein [Methylobacter sp.]|nr:phosphoribosyltransferase domain-containing protein [Methylobacter sp.]